MVKGAGWMRRKTGLCFALALMATCLVDGAQPGRCAGTERETAPEGRGSVFPGAYRLRDFLGGGAEYSTFAVEEAGVLTRRVTWPLLRGPLKISLGGSAMVGEGFRAGPVLLVEMHF